MFSQLIAFISRFADAIYRRHDPKRDSSYFRLTVVNILSVVAYGAAILLIASKLIDQQAKPAVPIFPHDFSVLVGAGESGCWQIGPTCPANPANKELWDSPVRRWSPQYYSLLAENLTAPYWLGVKISVDSLRKAQANGASRLMLGMLFARYDVWVNGQRIQTGDYLETDLPIAIDITDEQFTSGKDLYVALSVIRDGKMRTMDASWFVPEMGFFTPKGSDEQMRWVIFNGDSRFLIMSAVFLLLGAIFRFATQADGSKEESRAAATLAFILALMQVVMADSTFRRFGAEAYYRLLSSLVVSEIAAIAMLGFAVSRSRKGLVRGAAAIVPLSILVGTFLPTKFLDDGVFLQFVLMWLTPFAYASAGMVVLSQFVSLQTSAKGYAGQPSVDRNTTLLIVSLLVMTTALAFILETRASPTTETHWARYLIIFPLLNLASTLASDVRRTYKLLETVPISAYHKAAMPPREVRGVVINLDLKKSEQLFRAGAMHDMGGTIVSTIVSRLWARLAADGATVLQCSGDDLLLIFEDKKLTGNPSVWIDALATANEELQQMALQLADTHVELSGLNSLHFRAAVVVGAVRPIWRMVGETKQPGWVEAGEKNVFVDSARLIELERDHSIKSHSTGSVVVVSDDARPLLPDSLAFEEISGISKSGQMLKAYRIDLDAMPAHLAAS